MIEHKNVIPQSLQKIEVFFFTRNELIEIFKIFRETGLLCLVWRRVKGEPT